jgi:hypothetical protein
MPQTLMNQETRTYYIVMERPVGHGIWTYSSMACERHAAETRAITTCMWGNTCTQVVKFQLPKEPDVAAAYAAVEPLADNQDRLEETKRERDETREAFRIAMELSQKYKYERDEARNLADSAMWESDRLRSRVGNLTQASRSLDREPNSLDNL